MKDSHRGGPEQRQRGKGRWQGKGEESSRMFGWQGRRAARTPDAHRQQQGRQRSRRRTPCCCSCSNTRREECTRLRPGAVFSRAITAPMSCEGSARGVGDTGIGQGVGVGHAGEEGIRAGRRRLMLPHSTGGPRPGRHQRCMPGETPPHTTPPHTAPGTHLERRKVCLALSAVDEHS